MRRLLLIGLLTAMPLVVTWLVFSFLFGQLSRVGGPGVLALSRALYPMAPDAAQWLLQSWFQSFAAAVITPLLLVLLGWFSSRLLGQRIIGWAEALLERVPLVAAVYGATKRFVATLRECPAGVQRVVLIEFPSPDMKTIGFVTKVMRDQTTGEALAAVYVPTAPNPTSGYIEIVPLSKVVSTDWSMDEAMTFVMTGGANAPDTITFHGATIAEPEHPPAPDRVA
ncbi:MAG: DUF502 domain-containing protein [Gammaproteobacteria bacterium]